MGQDQATVVVGTFGDESWAILARDRAIPSAASQAPVIHVHGATLAQAQRRARAGTTEYVLPSMPTTNWRPTTSSGCWKARRTFAAVRHVWPSWTSRPEVAGLGSRTTASLSACGPGTTAASGRCIGPSSRGRSAGGVRLERRLGIRSGLLARRAGRSSRFRRRSASPTIAAAVATAPRSVGLKWHRAISSTSSGGHSVIRPLKVSILIPAGPRPRPASPH